MKRMSRLATLKGMLAFLALTPLLSLLPTEPEPRRLEILFLGHESRHHESEKLASILLKEYFKAGINISYTTDPAVLDEAALASYEVSSSLFLSSRSRSHSPSVITAIGVFGKPGCWGLRCFSGFPGNVHRRHSAMAACVGRC